LPLHDLQLLVHELQLLLHVLQLLLHELQLHRELQGNHRVREFITPTSRPNSYRQHQGQGCSPEAQAPRGLWSGWYPCPPPVPTVLAPV